LNSEFKSTKTRAERISYIDLHTTLWGLLYGGEKFENARQFENKLAMGYQQQQQQQRQQLIAGGNEET
jgi:hypothetical protein